MKRAIKKESKKSTCQIDLIKYKTANSIVVESAIGIVLKNMRGKSARLLGCRNLTNYPTIFKAVVLTI